MTDKPTWLDNQITLALCAFAGCVFGGITFLIQLLTGGPTWLPYVVGLVVFVIDALIIAFIQAFGHRH